MDRNNSSPRQPPRSRELPIIAALTAGCCLLSGILVSWVLGPAPAELAAAVQELPSAAAEDPPEVLERIDVSHEPAGQAPQAPRAESAPTES